MFIRRIIDNSMILGVAAGFLFGFVNLAVTWFAPLLDDNPRTLLAFYGPMFLLWAAVAFRAARRSCRFMAGVTTGIIVAFATFWAFDVLIILRVNLFLNDLTCRGDWQNMLGRFRASSSDNVRLFVTMDYIKGAPLKCVVSCAIGAVMGVIGAALDKLTRGRLPARAGA
jgi:hypothetical protein